MYRRVYPLLLLALSAVPARAADVPTPEEHLGFRPGADFRLAPWSAAGTAERQAWVADLADAGVFGNRGEPGFARSADWRIEADRILARRR